MKTVDKWWTLKQQIRDKMDDNLRECARLQQERNTLQMVLNSMDEHDRTAAFQRQADIVSPQMADPSPCSTGAQTAYDDYDDCVRDSGAK